MNRVLIAIIVGMLLISGTAASIVVAQEPADQAGNETSEVNPGERLSAAIGVQDAEIEGEISERSFGIAIARANSDAAKADIVQQRLALIADRLEQLEERKAELNASRNADEITDGHYRAQTARLEAERVGVERLTTKSRAVAEGLPTDTLEDAGVDVEQIDELRNRASDLGGREVAEIARAIAGPGVGAGPSDRAENQTPDDRGPPLDVDVTDAERESASNDVDDDELTLVDELPDEEVVDEETAI